MNFTISQSRRFPAPIQLIGIAIIPWSELRWQWKTYYLFKYLTKKRLFLCFWMIKAIFMLLKETVPFCLLSGLVYCTDFWNEDTGKFISHYLSFFLHIVWCDFYSWVGLIFWSVTRQTLWWPDLDWHQSTKCIL